MSETPTILTFPQFSNTRILIASFSNVKNSPEIRKQIVAANLKYNFAMIDGNTIVSKAHVLSAIYRALLDRSQDSIRTKTIHSEIVFSLSPNQNIMDSLKRFGINDKTTNLIVIKIIDLQGVSKENELNEINKVEDIIKEIISGDRIEFNDHAIQTNLDKKIVKKNYKLGAKFSDDIDILSKAVIGAVTLRGYQ